MTFANRSLDCCDCQMPFLFSAGEQEFFAAKALVNEPKRCPNCRVLSRLKRSGNEKSATQTACADCGAIEGIADPNAAKLEMLDAFAGLLEQSQMDQKAFDQRIKHLLGEFHFDLDNVSYRSLDWRKDPEAKAELLKRMKTAAEFCDKHLAECDPPEGSFFEHIEVVRYGFLYAISILEGSKVPPEPTIFRRAAKRGQRQIRFH